MTDYELQEDFLNKVAEMYTSFTADSVADMLSEDFHYSSFRVFEEIESRDAYLNYITHKLEAMKKSGVKFNYIIIKIKPHLKSLKKKPFNEGLFCT